ncbi:hypothetical protein QJS04_geneDACA004421 [Acorus gramineus]|uniref:DUF4283 domain-containing protein n=1 Tax=Acorus gramineus TaxID=55184 RepID=A0AAV9B3P3_ACOGR|nr:hypothetical protein QJS04_geneDACA004421 [Acorus gramineus]
MEDPAPPDQQDSLASKPKSTLVPRAGTIDNILRSLSPSGKEVMIDSPPWFSGKTNPSVSHTKNVARVPSTLRQAEKGMRLVHHGCYPRGPPIARSNRTWEALFPTQPRRQPNTVLTPVELESHEGRKFVDCDEEDLKEMDSHWGLSLVGYVIGKQLYMDTATASQSRVAFARVCIEISAQSELPDSVLYREEGIWKDIPVEYEWKPSPCPNCSTFGHSSAQCAVTPKPQKASGGKHI